MWQNVVGLLVEGQTIVETRDVDGGGKAVVQRVVGLVDAHRYWASGVEAMADVLQESQCLVALGVTLVGHFVADAPHHHTRVVAIVLHHVHHVAFSPFVEETVIAVLALRHVPFVERLYHHHETHLVAQLHQFGGRHVVRSTDGIAAHVFQQSKLTAKGRFVDGRT